MTTASILPSKKYFFSKSQGHGNHSGQTLVHNQVIHVGNRIKIEHKFRGIVDGYILNYDGCMFTIKPTGQVNTIMVNKGLITKIINK